MPRRRACGSQQQTGSVGWIAGGIYRIGHFVLTIINAIPIPKRPQCIELRLVMVLLVTEVCQLYIQRKGHLTKCPGPGGMFKQFGRQMAWYTAIRNRTIAQPPSLRNRCICGED